LVAYLVSLNQTFLSVSDSNLLFGFGEPQAAALTNRAINGAYAGFTTTPATFKVVVFSGEFTSDGSSPTGHITGTEDIGAASGPKPGVAFNATYSVSSSPTNERGTMTVTSGNGGKAVIYTISPSKFVAVSLSDPNPAVLIFQQALPPPTPSLSISSLTLSPTSVIGDAQSSTGTVVLSGPAPAGDARVPLSSDNGAASVPSSVTVPAGATSATFPVNTSAVAAPTPVTISASFGSVGKSATLTVRPATLSSLTLNPTSVGGGAQSSTGTVTLTGPAPAGGAQVALSSSNSAASVPPSVTVPAGATSATFRVNTSLVLFPTSVTISASYEGSTRTANLTVNPLIGGIL
jgi:hypothetical protein